jgi:hypothetical protein
MASRIGVIVLVLGLVAQQSSQIGAMQSAGQFMAYGYTTESCGFWVASSGQQKELLKSWMFGFISGADWGREKHLARTDTKGIGAWLDKYCGEHPLAPIVKAAVDLVTELGRPCASRTCDH